MSAVDSIDIAFSTTTARVLELATTQFRRPKSMLNMGLSSRSPAEPKPASSLLFKTHLSSARSVPQNEKIITPIRRVDFTTHPGGPLGRGSRRGIDPGPR